MKKVIGIIVLICVLAGAAYLFGRDKIGTWIEQIVPGIERESETSQELGQPVACVRYVNTFLALDLNGIVCANTENNPQGIPQITGIEFNNLIYGKKAETDDGAGLSYALKVAVDLSKNKIAADEINYDKGTVTIIIDRLKIKLGRNDKTDDKINDLADFIDNVLGKDGTLNMQNANANNYGYTFRENSNNVDISY